MLFHYLIQYSLAFMNVNIKFKIKNLNNLHKHFGRINKYLFNLHDFASISMFIHNILGTV